MKVGLIDVDGHNFPNFALMKIASYHRMCGDSVEWALPMYMEYDVVYASKIFTFSSDYNKLEYKSLRFVEGGTGYSVTSQLPDYIDKHRGMDYSLYPQYPFSIQFFSRGCFRNCSFCLVREKEGFIHRVEPVDYNPNMKWIEVLDNNFFANEGWKYAMVELQRINLPVTFHGVDVRIINLEQIECLNTLKLKGEVHIAFDAPDVGVESKIEYMVQHFNRNKLACYVLVGNGSTVQDDLYRLNFLKKIGVRPFVQPFRDYTNKRKVSQYEKDLARWANRPWIFKTCDFADFEPRKNFTCKEYLN